MDFPTATIATIAASNPGGTDAVFRTDGNLVTNLPCPKNIFLDGEPYICLKLRSLEIREHSRFLLIIVQIVFFIN